MTISCTTITFRIDIDFEGSDVDMVLKEMTSRGVTSSVPSILCDGAKIKVDKKKLPKTPTEESVDFALNWLYGFVDKQRMCTTTGRSAKFQLRENEKTELERIGIDVVSIYGLIQGCCHLICECDLSIFTPELVENAKKITNDVFRKFVKYYKNDKSN